VLIPRRSGAEAELMKAPKTNTSRVVFRFGCGSPDDSSSLAKLISNERRTA
jgi:hypothetical protein